MRADVDVRLVRPHAVRSATPASVTDLFATANPAAPLADRLRPRTIAEVIGQRQLLATGKPLAVAFASGKPHSMILWGPPGVGKTTLARLMADAFNAEFIALSAVLAGGNCSRRASRSPWRSRPESRIR